jgi:hypothetical protein
MIDDLIARMQAMLEPLQSAGDPRQYFHGTYLRTTMAVAAELKRGGFTDPDWTERWDVAFANLYMDALSAATTVISDEEFDDPAVIARREADHKAIDRVLAGRVAAEDDELISVSGPGSVLNRLLRPLNQRGSQRFLRESRKKVWANAVELSRARRKGPDAYAAVLADLEELSAAKVAALQKPGLVLLRLAVIGFGIRLPDSAGS